LISTASRVPKCTRSVAGRLPTDFDEHIQALDYYNRIPETIAPIEKRLREELEQAHGKDWCARWFEGLPEYVELPGQINVTEILRLWTYAKALDLVQWGKFRYNLLSGGGGHWFPGEHAARLDEVDLRDALRASPFAEKIPDILRQAHQLLFDKPQKRLGRS
jgi:predicted aldo/keto reductase-like oxidoreductase